MEYDVKRATSMPQPPKTFFGHLQQNIRLVGEFTYMVEASVYGIYTPLGGSVSIRNTIL